MAQLSEVVFALERFELSADERLEVVGRWEGLQGRRMGRAVLTVVDADGRRRRLNALPGGQMSSTRAWRAAFAWDGDVSTIERAELELGRRLVVELPAPRRRRRRSAAATSAERASQPTEAAAAVVAPPPPAPESSKPITAEPVAPAAPPSAPPSPALPAAAVAALNGDGQVDTGRAELEAQIEALGVELASARAEAADLHERLQTARDGIIERDRRLMTLQESADCAAEDATARLDAERAEAAEVRTKLAEAREEAERARTEATEALAAEAAETERLREELQVARRHADEIVATERAATARLREELAAGVATSEGADAEDGLARRTLDHTTRDLERERATNRTLRRELEAAQAEVAELRRAVAVTPGGADQPTVPQRGPVAAHRVDVARAAGAHLVPDHHPSPARLWAARVGAAVLVGMLLLALALIVAPLL